MRTALAAIILSTVAAACSFEPTTCVEANCDGETEMCVLAGSDTFEPDSASCQPIVEGCEEDPTCECLDGVLSADEGNRFCFDAGGCTENNGVVELVCPGG